MSEEKKTQIVNEALEKAYSALANISETDMASGEFLNLLCAIDHLEYLCRDEAPAQPEQPEQPDPQTETETETTTSQYTLAQVKTALVAARKKGTNVAELIRSVGGEDINSVPASQYDALMEKLNEGAAHAS